MNKNLFELVRSLKDPQDDHGQKRCHPSLLEGEKSAWSRLCLR